MKYLLVSFVGVTGATMPLSSSDEIAKVLLVTIDVISGHYCRYCSSTPPTTNQKESFTLVNQTRVTARMLSMTTLHSISNSYMLVCFNVNLFSVVLIPRVTSSVVLGLSSPPMSNTPPETVPLPLLSFTVQLV